MPDTNHDWTYQEIESVAVNLEYLSRQVYNTMSEAVYDNPNHEYAERMPRVLAELVDAAENFTDSVYDHTDYSDDIYDLFYLDSQLTLAETTLDGYSKSYLVDSQMRSLRYYVNELLWNYRINYLN
ncbi:MAG: hypothetical protein COT73_06905 [Bdellovibrio sp. CG10_big_fil_rev_8_21_14_0_10_47_8]|nr:MAG: hypothetical protein COT73_06905 [Bdellovibrio sp. CG10_big_fil_rev_8_21_14_0_10_47_8]